MTFLHCTDLIDVLILELSELGNLYQIVLHLVIHFNCIHVTFRYEIYQTSLTI